MARRSRRIIGAARSRMSLKSKSAPNATECDIIWYLCDLAVDYQVDIKLLCPCLDISGDSTFHPLAGVNSRQR